MADTSVLFQRRIEEQLTCSVCLELYKDPRVLICQHSFCLKCLQALKQGEKDGGVRYLNCPSCRKETELPTEGQDSLPSAFYLNNMIDELQAAQRQPSQSIADSSIASIVQAPSIGIINAKEVTISSAVMCPTHRDEQCRAFCVDCQILICVNCIVTSHKGHDCKTMKEVFEVAREEVSDQLAIIKERVEEGMESLEDITKRENEIKLQETTLKKQVANYTELIKSSIEESHKNKMQQIEDMTEKKMKKLNKQKVLLQENVDVLVDVLSGVERVIEKGSQEELLSRKKSMMTQLQSLITTSETKVTPCESADVKFVRNASLFTKAQELGYFLLDEDTSYQMKCNPPLLTGEMATISITLPKRQRIISLLHQGINLPPFTCTVTCNKSGVCTQCSIEPCEFEYIYTASFIPTAPGEHMLTITSDDIREEQKLLLPYIYPSPDVRHHAVPIMDSLDRPTGVTIGKEEGEIIIVDNGANSLLLLSSNGCVTTTNSSYLINPWGVALNKDGNAFVTDEHRLIKINPYNGHVIKYIGSTKKGSRDTQFNTPKGVRVHPFTNEIYVADSGNHRITVYDSNLIYSNKFGAKGSKLGAFNRPTDVAFDKNGLVYVTNQLIESIDVYTPVGVALRRIGPREEGESGTLSPGSGELKSPIALTIDAFDNIYITEVSAPLFSMVVFRDSRITVYRTNGAYVHRFGRRGRKGNDLGDPCGIAIDKDGKLYVCDTENKRVIVM